MGSLLPWSVLVVVAAIVANNGRLCQAVVVLEHQDTTLNCDISPTAPRTSPVYWYSNSLYEYLTSDFEVIQDLADAAPSLYQRLSVVGSVRRGKYNLRITDVKANDAGDYLCGYYRNGDEWITVKTVAVEVLSPPGREFPACSVQSPMDTLLLPGMLVNLSCISYGGSPRADLAWYRDGVPIDSVVTYDGLWVYHQRLIREEDSGVQFTCEATSSALMESKRCSITPYRRAPLLHIRHSHDGLVGSGDAATFTCASQGEVAVSTGGGGGDGARYRWYYNGEPAEDIRSGILSGDYGSSLTLLDITSEDNKAVISCEKVDEFTARSSASLTIQLVSPMYPMPIGGGENRYPTPSAQTTPTSESLTYISQIGFVASIIGAFCFGMFLMLTLILLLRLFCKFTSRRGRLDFNNERDITVGWKKTTPVSPVGGEKQNPISVNIENPIHNSVVRTYKKPNGITPNVHSPVKGCDRCLETSNADDREDTDASPKRSTSRLSPYSRQAVSYDLLPSGQPTNRKKPPPLTLFNDTRKPLLSSPSPSAMTGRRLPSVDREYTASMPDLATYHFGEPTSFADHDYVNLPPVTTSREGSGSSTPSSYVNCEFGGSNPPTTPVRKQSLKPFHPGEKSLSYAKLDLPIIGERPSTPFSPSTPEATKQRAGSVSVERTKYAQIAYVFKDRRQQSLPSVKLVGLTEGFGDKV